MSLPLAFFAKTSRRLEIMKVLCFTGFPSTGLVWGESRGLEPFPRVEPFWGRGGGEASPVVWQRT